ncbi:MAG TPA: 2Fe-2S iron-sulfur cluster-binding protein [Vicinamibacteria bacterium]|nr:2Fe-2S iron-sulfur cluster-binding protein [Vicinamibacteria bacterium]
MTVMESTRLVEFLEGLAQADWVEALDELGPSIHPVDREATRIWFAFWPLDLHQALSGNPRDAQEMARLMDLEGNWRLEDQLDTAAGFLYGAHFWVDVKEAILRQSEPARSLARTIRDVAARAAEAAGTSEDLVIGITAVGLMMLRQAGHEALARVATRPAKGPLLKNDPAKVMAARRRQSRDGLFTFLRGTDRRWEVRWDEARGASFRAINGQDIAMAAAADEGDYRNLDYRRIDGPVPVECRVGSCGYCWVGVLSGREKLSEISAFEKERLRYFGYDTVNGEDPRPPIRLSCQTQCHGDVTVSIPPWNGELNRRHDEGRKKMGLA